MVEKYDQVPNFEPKNDLKKAKFAFLGHFWSKRPVSTIFPPYIMPNGTYERITKFGDTLPLKNSSLMAIRYDVSET